MGNTTAFCELEDGVNEYGLAVGLTYVYPTIRKPGWNAGYLVRYLLERCKTVSEALGCLRRLDIIINRIFEALVQISRGFLF